MRKTDLHILVVDDSKVMRRIIRHHLEALGYGRVLEAASGRQALQRLGEHRVGLILSDWVMPGMHGIELLRRVRADQATHHLPFIMISAEAQPHLLSQALEARVSDYVVKPFTRERLRKSLEKVLRGQAGQGHGAGD